MTAPNNQPVPEGFRRLSSKWLEKNVAPKDVIFHYPYDDLWGPSQYQGKLIPSYDRSQFTYATARTDLPREAYADSEPGAEVASERAEDTNAELAMLRDYVGSSYLLSDFQNVQQMRDAIATLRAQLEKAQAFKTWVHDWLDKNGVPHDPDPEHTKECGCRINGRMAFLRSRAESAEAERDKLRAEVEHRAKQRDEFQNLFIEASDGFNQRGEQLARLTAELDAVRKERVSDVKPPEIMFAVYAREPGSDNWFEQETNTDEALVREWRDRNNERSAQLYDPPREYILVKKETTFTKLQ